MLVIIVFAMVLIFTIAFGVYKVATPSEIQATNTAGPIFDAYKTVMQLAPLGCPTTPSYRLCDYYVASSAYSLFPGSKLYDYITDAVIPMLMPAGPRLVELDIYSDENNQPVVGLKNQKTGVDYAYNTISFEACCVAIVNNAFNSVVCPVSTDPFMLSLVFHTDNTNVVNAAAQILKTTCISHMLDTSYSYQRKNIAVEPICNLQSKLIIVSGGPIKGTLMEELVNLSWDTSHLRRLTYTQASQTNDNDELINNNRNNITMVVPDVSDDLRNMNPQILLTYGCQWVLMNYGSPDSAMELYISQFQQASCVLKPEPLRALAPKKYASPTMPDPVVSFQPLNKTSPLYNITI